MSPWNLGYLGVVLGHWKRRDLEIGAIRKLGCGFLFAVSVAICEIFSVKEWRDLENQVRGRSRSLKIAPFDRPYVTLYRSAIVNIALSCTIFELFDVELYRDLEIGVRGHSSCLKFSTFAGLLLYRIFFLADLIFSNCWVMSLVIHGLLCLVILCNVATWLTHSCMPSVNSEPFLQPSYQLSDPIPSKYLQGGTLKVDGTTEWWNSQQNSN